VRRQDEEALLGEVLIETKGRVDPLPPHDLKACAIHEAEIPTGRDKQRMLR
jgi:hypothetical protein